LDFEARMAGGDIRSPQRKLWVDVGERDRSSQSERHSRNCREAKLFMSPRWGSGSRFATFPTARAVGYGYFVGFANWLAVTAYVPEACTPMSQIVASVLHGPFRSMREMGKAPRKCDVVGCERPIAGF
jgi:hypothetical protein